MLGWSEFPSERKMPLPMRWLPCDLSLAAPTRLWTVLICLISSVLAAAPAVLAQSDVGAFLEQARAAEKTGDYQAAERVYLQALALAPGNLETLKRLGVLQQTELKFGESIESFKQVLAREAQYPEVNFFLGVSYFGENDFNQAIRSFELELGTLKPHPRCRYYLALALQAAGQIDESISQLNRTVAENPKDADAFYQLARIHKNASIHAIEKLKALDQDSFQLHALMGEVYADDERYAEAIKEYQAALAKRPDATGIHYAIGVAYWVQHQLDAAKKEFKDDLKENPNDALTNLYLGDIAVHEELGNAIAVKTIPKKRSLNFWLRSKRTQLPLSHTTCWLRFIENFATHKQARKNSQNLKGFRSWKRISLSGTALRTDMDQENHLPDRSLT